MKTRKLFIAVLCAFSAALFASGLETANKLYEEGKYPEAITAYKVLIAEGNKSAEALYNLGNAYFKEQKVGYAVLNYERARKIAPRDVDIKYNLDFAKSFVKESAVEDQASKLLSGVYYFLTLNELCVLLSAAFLSLLGLLFVRMYLKNELTYWLTFSFSILFLVLLVFSSARILEEENTKAAIIVSASVEARSAPIESNPASFTIPVGKKVLILNTRNEWIEVLLKSENIKGWIKKDALSEI